MPALSKLYSFFCRNALLKNTIVVFIILFPCATYFYIVMQSAVNIPYWDDYSVVLGTASWAMNAMSKHAWAFNAYLFGANAGHVPMITHAVAWLQIVYLGGVDFKLSTIAGNTGLLFAAGTMVWYFSNRLKLPLYSAIPIPFLLLSIVHWEAMAFMVPSWQFYWGACLFPMLAFIAIAERRWILASIAFTLAIFLSSGSLSIYPLILLFCILKKYWRGACIFGALASLSLLKFFQHLPSSEVEMGLPDAVVVFNYIIAFMGSFIPDRSGMLESYATLHRLLGVLVILTGIYLLRKNKAGDALKLVFVYVLLLSVMAVCMRGYSGVLTIPSRYSLFSLMALVCLYGLHLSSSHKSAIPFKVSVITVSLAAILLWSYSLYTCLYILNDGKRDKISAVREYRQSGDTEALKRLLWDPEYGKKILERSEKSGVYNIKNAKVD